MEAEINYSLYLLVPLIIYVMFRRTKSLISAYKPENRESLKMELLFFSIALLVSIGLIYIAI